MMLFMHLSFVVFVLYSDPQRLGLGAMIPILGGCCRGVAQKGGSGFGGGQREPEKLAPTMAPWRWFSDENPWNFTFTLKIWRSHGDTSHLL